MDMLRVAGFALCAACICLLVRRAQPELAGAVSLAAGAMTLAYALAATPSLTGFLTRLSTQGGVNEGYIALLLKVVGLAYVAELAAQACCDLGEEGLARKVGLCGKLAIFALAAPLLTSLTERILSLTQ